ncbi:MAG: hypothetical protein K2X00_11185 [Nitrospiraceae bacterium]|nr:hypothetical protein [Nitrospiraceae bacterium]
MLTEQLRDAIAAAPHDKLPEMAALLWRAFGEGRVSESEAEALSAAIDMRKRPSALAKPAPKRRAGARPRTPESLARRRRWAASGALPPQLAARFTQAEVAALAVVTGQVVKNGRCTLTVGHIAAVAGVCATSVRNALREARQLGLVNIEERRLTGQRNASNRITIIAPEWCAWVERRGGCKTVNPTDTNYLIRKIAGQTKRKKGAIEGTGSSERKALNRSNRALARVSISDKLSHSVGRP